MCSRHERVQAVVARLNAGERRVHMELWKKREAADKSQKKDIDAAAQHNLAHAGGRLCVHPEASISRIIRSISEVERGSTMYHG